MPAINPVKLLTAANATATNNSTTITITGSVDASRIFQGSVISIGGFTPVEALSGTLPDGSGNSTITLRDPWPETTVTARLTAFNTIEGLTGAIEKARQVVEQTSGLEEVAGTGLLEKTAENTYDIAPFTTQGRNLVAGVDAAAQRTTLGLGDAATKTVTTSATDTTAGRVTTVGYGGIGTGVKNMAGYSDDVYDIEFTGFYRVALSATNIPVAENGYIISQYRAATAATLTFITDSGRMFFASKSTNWSSWQEIYHSGNSVNPLDFGLGGISTLTNDFDAIDATGFYKNNSGSAVGIPFAGSTFTVQHIKLSSTESTQFAIDGFGSTTAEKCFFRSKDGAGNWQAWQELYHSGNSVNPLDFGVGGNAPVATDIQNLPSGSVSGYLAGTTAGILPSSIAGSILTMARAAGRQVALAISDFGQNAKPRAYIGSNDGVTYSDWEELYHSGNSVNPLDFGIGTGVEDNPSSTSDVYAITYTGITRVNNSSANLPVAENGYIHSAYRSSSFIQLTFLTDSGRMFTATKNTTWGDWQEIYHSGNDGGVEFGSNANGSYTKFPDGTLICTHAKVTSSAVTTASGSLFETGSTDWIYPYAFIGIPAFTHNVQANLSRCWSALGDSNATATQASFRVLRTTSNAGTPLVGLTVIGRWK